MSFPAIVNRAAFPWPGVSRLGLESLFSPVALHRVVGRTSLAALAIVVLAGALATRIVVDNAVVAERDFAFAIAAHEDLRNAAAMAFLFRLPFREPGFRITTLFIVI